MISASPKIAYPRSAPAPTLLLEIEAVESQNEPRMAPSRRPGVNPFVASDRSLFGITEIEGGFPHSEILGSKPVRGSPGLIAAYHVLHRLSAPRHPPDTLKTLDCSHCQRAPCGSARNKRSCDRSSHDFAPSTRQSTDPPPRARLQDGVGLFEKTSFASNASGSSSGQA